MKTENDYQMIKKKISNIFKKIDVVQEEEWCIKGEQTCINYNDLQKIFEEGLEILTIIQKDSRFVITMCLKDM
jgi:hypothetical protein